MSSRTIAIGDIHGCFYSFKTLIENEIQLTKTDKLILLGDYIDRGLQSKELIDYILELQKQNFDIITLLGNHEALLLDAYKDTKHLSKWLINGGAETLDSFAIKTLSELDSKYIKFFESLKPYYQIDNYLFVHAGFNNDTINPFSDTYSMLWKSRSTYTHPLLKNKIIIHGHSPIKVDDCLTAIKDSRAVINIDTGCVYKEHKDYARLTAYPVHDKRVYFV